MAAKRGFDRQKHAHAPAVGWEFVGRNSARQREPVGPGVGLAVAIRGVLQQVARRFDCCGQLRGRKRIHRQAADQIGGSIGKTLGNVAQCEVRLVARDVDEILRHVQLQVDGWKPSAKILEARGSAI